MTRLVRICLSLLFLISVAAVAVAENERPNIIVVFTDDHGWPDIGAAGIHGDLETPHLDALAASGVRATNGYVTAPQCVPSRAGLLAGRSQNRFGVESNGAPLDGFDAQRTIAERLKEAGYATGQIGKWHLGPTDAITGHGFGEVYSKHANRPCHANFTLAGESIEMQVVDDGLYHLDACSRAAVSFVRRHAKDPFFLYLAYRAPHVPLDAPREYLDRFPGEMPERRRQALAMISAMDDGVGMIVAELAARGLTKKTLIFFIGDNGAPLKIHKHDAPGGGPGWDGSLNEPMNGEKGMLSEGGIRVPFLVSFPGTIPEGQVYEHPIWSLDVAATAAALAGLPVDDGFDGVNLVPWLSGEKTGAPHRFLAWRWISQSAIREGKWKLLRGGKREYLFDLDTDPGEQSDLGGVHPEIADRLRDRLESWTDELQPPGLATKPMSEVWDRYFDFYLEGKAAPPLRAEIPPGNKKSGGWIGRNGRIEQAEGALRIVPEDAGRRPFIAATGIRVKGPLTIMVKLKTARTGSVDFSWRNSGQKEFPKGQTVSARIGKTGEWKEISADIPSEGEVIHLRIQLPGGESQIAEVALSSAAGKRLKTWDFAERANR